MNLKTEYGRIFRNAAAMYIEDDFADLARGIRTKRGVKLLAIRRDPLVKKSKQTQHAEIVSELDAVFAKSFAESEPLPYRIASNLKNDSVVLRHFTLTGIKSGDAARAVAFEAQRHIPYQVEELIYKFETYSVEQGSTEVVFTGAEKKAVDSLTSYFSDKGILPSVVESTPALIARALNLENLLTQDGAYISIHYEPSDKVLITGVYHRHPHFFREIRLLSGEETINAADASYPSLKDVWPVIEKDLVGSIAYLRKATKQAIAKVFVSGFAPSPDEMDTVKSFGVPFERAGTSFAGGSDLADDRYLPALALLYDSLRPSQFNLSSSDCVKKDLRSLKEVVLVSALAFTAIIALHFMLTIAGSVPAKKVSEIKKNISDSFGISRTASSADINTYAQEITEKAIFVRDTFVDRARLSGKMGRAGEGIPANAWLDSMQYRNALGDISDKYFILKGFIYAEGEKGVASANDIVQRLKGDQVVMEGFRTVSLSSVDKAVVFEKQITKFEIVIN